MAVPHGSAAAVSIDNSSGTPVDFAAYTKSINFNPDMTMHIITVLGLTAQKKTVGLKDSKFTLDIFADPVASLHINNLYVAQTPGSSTTWSLVYGPNGSTSGFQRISVEFFVISYNVTSQVDQPREMTVQCECTGSITFDTY